MYNQNQQVTIANRNPPKKATLRLPNSAEMLDRIRGQKTIRTSIGRGKAKTDLAIDEEADLALFQTLRQDQDGDKFTPVEARLALQRITYHEVTGCERVGGGYCVTLKTPFGDTVHTVREPMEVQLFEYGRSSSGSTELRHGREELFWLPEAGVKLYDAIFQKAEGYAEGTEVPAHHKCAVAAELSQAIAELDPQIELGPNS